MSKTEIQMRNPANRIVIVGGGFAGVTLAQRLERMLPTEWEIVVLSADNHLVFTPMLPEVVGRTISPLDVVVAGRQLTRRTRWLEGCARRIDREKNQAHYVLKTGKESSLDYSHLVLACGSMVNMDTIPGLAARGHPLKTVMDAIILGNDVIGNFETAAAEPDASVRGRLLTVVVIGGGFSGVEVAGHIADLMRAGHRFYPELRKETPRVVLLQKRDRILPELNHKSLSEFALKKLRENGIGVRLETTAEKVTPTAVRLASGEEIEAALIVSTVGTDTRPLIKDLGLALENGRLATDPDMKVKGTSNLWALGDCALIPNAHDDNACPATAQFAVQQARQLAGNLKRALDGAATRPFRYRPRGMLASIGQQNAVAEIYGVKLSGFIAWFLWRGIYLFKLPTFGHKLRVAFAWAWNIFFSPNIVQFGLPSSRPEKKTDNSESNAQQKC